MFLDAIIDKKRKSQGLSKDEGSWRKVMLETLEENNKDEKSVKEVRRSGWNMSLNRRLCQLKCP